MLRLLKISDEGIVIRDPEGNTKSTLIELNSRGRILNEDLPVGFCDQFEYNAKKLLFGR